MYGEEKSDSLIVSGEAGEQPEGAESVERRSGAKGTRKRHTCADTEPGKHVTEAVTRAEAAKQRKKRFTALFHLLTVEALEAASSPWAGKRPPEWMASGRIGLRRKHEEQHNRSAPEATSGQLQGAARQASLHPKSGWKTTPARHRLAGGQDRPVLRWWNPERSLWKRLYGVLIRVQTRRSQHDALDALATGLVRTNVNWVLGSDISQFFDRVSHEWLIRFTEHRIGDRRVIRLIRKWLTAGTSEEVDGEQRRKAPTGCGRSHRCSQTYTSTTSSICGRISGDVAMPQAMW